MTNLVYFGSPAFSAQILSSLLSPSKLEEDARYSREEGVVVAVVTQPDKPQGRKQVLAPSPVAQLATKYDLPVFKPEKLDDENLTHLKLLRPDIFLVVSYGKIIPKDWLTSPKIGTFNLHFSLLPKYRGALCISEAIKNQDTETGVTLMVMDEDMDTGPIISQEKVSLDINDNCETLTNKLTLAGIKLLAAQLPQISTNYHKLPTFPQDNSLATYTPTTKTRNRQSAFIPWSEIKKAMAGEGGSATHTLVRSLNPDPGAWTRIPVSSSQNQVSSELEVKIIKTRLDTKYLPADRQGLILDTIQLPGKSPISWKQFIGGHQS